MKPRILLIGGVGVGKTTLKQCLMQETQAYRKTQMLEFKGLFIDCPGEYLQMPTYYRVLIDASHRVAEVWALQDASNKRTIFPPNFAKVFNKPVVGIITKIDRADAMPETAEKILRQAGVVAPVFSISAREGIGVEPLIRRMEAFAPDA
ncbi:MAG: EutP/PduV family microcompartment system protein [Negativicutes bacterium]